MSIFRSLLFNLFYYSITAVLCFAYLPFLLLPRKAFVRMVRFWLTLVYIGEKYILGLDYELRGTEHIPKDKAFLVAAKHQSAYETQKLHLIFDDPAIILKKELLSIPMWGWYARKARMIAIDRSSPKRALSSIVEGAKQIKEQGRPIVIFPQGTRVRLNETAQDKPYKSGIAKMYEATDLPILPLALNSGLFWPKNAFFKKPGKVILECLPLIPAGRNIKDIMPALEKNLEEKSQALIEESQNTKTNNKTMARLIRYTLAIAVVLCLAYTGAWYYIKNIIEEEIDFVYEQAVQEDYAFIGDRPVVSGFPGPYNIHWKGVLYGPDNLRVEIPSLHITGWPLPLQPVVIEMPEGIRIEHAGMMEFLDHFLLEFISPKDFPSPVTESTIRKWQQKKGNIRLKRLMFSKDLIRVQGSGTFSLDNNLQLLADLDYRIYGFETLLSTLKEQNNLSGMRLMLAYKLTDTLSKTDPETAERFVDIPVKIQNRKLYLGPILAGHLSALHWPSDNPPAVHPQ